MHLERLSHQELIALHGIVGRKAQFFAQDVVNFAIIGNDWQVNIRSDNVYRGDRANFEVSGLRVRVEDIPRYSPKAEFGFAYTPILADTVIRDVRILYHLWQDEWTVNNESFNVRLEGGVVIDTDGGFLVALLEPYDLAYSYPFAAFQLSIESLKSTLDDWASHYEILPIQSILKASHV
jgi:hypothetical protein